MLNNLAQNIELGPRQLSLFESESDAAAEQDCLKACIVGSIGNEGQFDLFDMLQMAAGTLGWSESKVLQHLFWLAQDFEILFKIDKKKITISEARNILITSISPDVQIALNEPADESVFLKVMISYQRVCDNANTDAVYDQAEFARLIISAIRDWKSTLESCRRHAQRPLFPGKKDIETGLALIKLLSEKQDSFSLIHAFYEKSDEIELVAKIIEAMAGFYEHHKDRWQRMIDFAHESKDTLTNCTENPEVVSSYKRFTQILSSPRPYDLVDEADRLFKKLKIQSDKIVAHHTSQRRSDALSNVSSLIEKMKSHLQTHAASDDLRNQALYPLHVTYNQIKTAGTIRRIDRFMQEAQDAFEIFREEVVNQTR